jgi:hypothetical protein
LNSAPSPGKAGSTPGQPAVNVWPMGPSDGTFILSEGLRAQDVAELRAAGHSDPAAAFLRSIEVSEPDLLYTVTVSGVPAGIFGVAEHPDNPCVGIPWLLGSDRILRARRQLLREAPKWITLLLSQYPVLVNMVHEKNTVSIAWLKRMGFEFHEELQVCTGETFIRFTKELQSCASP